MTGGALVPPRRTGRDKITQGAHEAVDIGARRAEADRRTDRTIDAEPREQRMCAETAVTHADAMFCREIGGDLARLETVDGERHDPDHVSAVLPNP